MCVCLCVRVCVRECVCVCVRVRVRAQNVLFGKLKRADDDNTQALRRGRYIGQ